MPSRVRIGTSGCTGKALGVERYVLVLCLVVAPTQSFLQQPIVDKVLEKAKEDAARARKVVLEDKSTVKLPVRRVEGRHRGSRVRTPIVFRDIGSKFSNSNKSKKTPT